MCVLMFYVTEIDGVEGQWVAQLCGCKASSPLSACHKTEACQQLCVCVCVALCVCAWSIGECIFVCKRCLHVLVCVWQGGPAWCHCQQLSVSQVSSRCDTCWPRARTGHTGDGPDGCTATTRCVSRMSVCLCLCVPFVWRQIYHTCTASHCEFMNV